MNKVEQKTKKYIVPEDIFTDEDESLLMAARDNHRENSFLIGRIANKYIEKSSKAELPVTFREIYHLIGRMVGVPDRTVRYYAETERCYSRDVQLEYDILPFNVFNYAKTHDNWRDILDYAMEHPSYSLSAIKREFERTYSPESEKSKKEKELDQMMTSLQAVHSLTNLISNMCEDMQDLAEESGDELIQMEVDAVIADLRRLLAKLVDNRE